MARTRGKSIPVRINADIRAARSRGMDLASLHPLGVRPHKDPILEDDCYPMTARQAGAKARLSPAVWQLAVRVGWAIQTRMDTDRSIEHNG